MRVGQRTENLRKAHTIKGMGYKSILESRPLVTMAFLSLWQQGYSYRKCRDVLLAQFPAEDVPSHNALHHYIKNHLQDTEEGRNAYYKTLIKQFDSVKKTYSIALESQKLYQIAMAAHAGIGVQIRTFQNMSNANYRLFKMELAMGLRKPLDAKPATPSQQEYKLEPTREGHLHRINTDRGYNSWYLAKNRADNEKVSVQEVLDEIDEMLGKR